MIQWSAVVVDDYAGSLKLRTGSDKLGALEALLCQRDASVVCILPASNSCQADVSSSSLQSLVLAMKAMGVLSCDDNFEDKCLDFR